MASLSLSRTPAAATLSHGHGHVQFHPSPVIISFHSHRKPCLFDARLRALKAVASEGDNLLPKTLVQHQQEGNQFARILDQHDTTTDPTGYHYDDDHETWVDWEDQILEDTVPLVAFVRMILHSRLYESGDRLSPEHEKTILEKLLPFHPEFEKKIGCGIDYITIGYHPNFERSRCLFIARKDGELVDFSYWKCIKGLIRKNYPLYADSFILRHFRKTSRSL